MQQKWPTAGARAGLTVFTDRACRLASERLLRAVNPTLVDVLDRDSLARLAAGGVLLLGTVTTDGRSSRRVMSSTRSVAPQLVVMIARPRNEADWSAKGRWFRAGVDELVEVGLPADVTRTLELIDERRMAPPPAGELLQVQAHDPDGVAREAVLYALRNTHHDLRAAELAGLFGYSLKRLRELFQDAGYPSPGTACRCGRFLHLAELRALGVVTVVERVERLGFGTAEALRKARCKFRGRLSKDDRLAVFVASFPRLGAVVKSSGRAPLTSTEESRSALRPVGRLPPV